ncbi:MAG: beta strand repeat-containing protein, partial [Ignavibacteria bacterium]
NSLRFYTNNIERLSITSDGLATFVGNVDATSGLDVTGANLTVGGTNFTVAPANGNTSVGGTLTVFGTVSDGDGNVVIADNVEPSVNDNFSLGTNTARWSDVYVGPSTVHIGSTTAGGDEIAIGYNTTNNTASLNVGSVDVIQLTSAAVTMAAPVSISDNTTSTSSTTGALKVTGGLGVAENTNIGGTLGVTGATTLKATVINNLTSDAGTYVDASSSGLEMYSQAGAGANDDKASISFGVGPGYGDLTISSRKDSKSVSIELIGESAQIGNLGYNLFVNTTAGSAYAELRGDFNSVRADDSGITIEGAVTANSTMNVVDDLSVNTSMFTVDGPSGNTSIAGTLGVTGATTLNGNVTLGDASADAVTINAATVTAANLPTTGSTSDDLVLSNVGTLRTASVSSIVNGSSWKLGGNTGITNTNNIIGITETNANSLRFYTNNTEQLSITSAGLATFAGNVDATSGLDVTGANLTVGGTNFTVAPANGNTSVGGTLGVTGATTLS